MALEEGIGGWRLETDNCAKCCVVVMPRKAESRKPKAESRKPVERVFGSRKIRFSFLKSTDNFVAVFYVDFLRIIISFQIKCGGIEIHADESPC